LHQPFLVEKNQCHLNLINYTTTSYATFILAANRTLGI
jgi:hypothetical protein